MIWITTIRWNICTKDYYHLISARKQLRVTIVWGEEDSSRGVWFDQWLPLKRIIISDNSENEIWRTFFSEFVSLSESLFWEHSCLVEFFHTETRGGNSYWWWKKELKRFYTISLRHQKVSHSSVSNIVNRIKFSALFLFISFPFFRTSSLAFPSFIILASFHWQIHDLFWGYILNHGVTINHL